MKLNELAALIGQQRSWKVQEETGAEILEVALPEGRHQAVRLTGFEADGVPMARFTTRIGKAGALDAGRMRSALELNSKLSHGCLAISDGFLVMTDTRPLGTTTPQTSAEAIAFLAAQADRYERMIFGTDVQ
jgi:hypothetical protein